MSGLSSGTSSWKPSGICRAAGSTPEGSRMGNPSVEGMPASGGSITVSADSVLSESVDSSALEAFEAFEAFDAMAFDDPDFDVLDFLAPAPFDDSPSAPSVPASMSADRGSSLT